MTVSTKTNPSTNNPGIILVITYFILFTVNSLVIYLANLWFPHNVVLGTQSLSPIWALFLSMAVLSLIGTFAIPFINHYEKSRKQPLTPKDWMAAYFVLNFIGLWLVTRAAEQLGLGITSWVIAAILAGILDLAQGAAMMRLKKWSILGLLLALLLFPPPVWATPTELSTDQEITHPSPTPQPTATPTRRTSPQNQNLQAQTNTHWLEHLDNFQILQDQVTNLENQLSQFTGTDPKIVNWLNSWWLVGFWTGVLWLFPWVFVGWQWARLKFWGFGWPWPWWFWIPLLWWIPWLIIGWQWWLVWWPWWVWLWWLWPWLFWPFWWVILFKELTISLWHRRPGEKAITL